MFTELAILYSRYKEEKLMEHLKLFYQRINIPKVIRACQSNQQWTELTFLYVHYDEYDNAALTMINHSADAWEHALFKDVIVKVANLDLYYKGVQFYLEEQPLLVNDLLVVLTPRVDHTRTVQLVRRIGHLPLIKPYLVSVQQNNVTAVNDALNELYVEEENFESLRTSIDAFNNFDAIALANKLEKHELLEVSCRRVPRQAASKSQFFPFPQPTPPFPSGPGEERLITQSICKRKGKQKECSCRADPDTHRVWAQVPCLGLRRWRTQRSPEGGVTETSAARHDLSSSC